MLYVNRVKILVWEVRSEEYAQALTIPANHFWYYGGRRNAAEVIMVKDLREFIIPAMTFERCFTCLG